MTSDGNCNNTQAHLDPYIRGETPPCDPGMPATCQVGDLSGKYGTINGTSANINYHDPYVSLQPGLGAFFGNRSFVIHFANTTRLACANFSYIGEGGMIGNPSNGNGTTSTSAGTSTVSELVTSGTSTSSGSSMTTTTTTTTTSGAAASSKSTSSSSTSTKTGTGTGTASPAMVTKSGAGRIAQEWGGLSLLLITLLVFVW